MGWNERLRPKNNGNLTLDRSSVLNVMRTEVQVRPHDGFKATALAVAYPVRRETSGERTMRLAVPPAWTEAEGRPCHPPTMGDLTRRFTDKWDTSSEIDADALCTGCPVRVECLRAAIEEERGLSGSGRYLVRGGLTPHGRVRLEKQIADLEGTA
jgi:transcription factor WhiB